jgi:MoxR-like ATPase
MTALPLQRPPRPVRHWLVPAASRRAGSIGSGQMARHSPVRGHATGLTGRRSERDVLDRLIDAVRAGEGRALVLSGEPGVGKTTPGARCTS